MLKNGWKKEIKQKRIKDSKEKAYDYWYRTIEEGKPEFFRAGCDWMIQYWTQRFLDGK